MNIFKRVIGIFLFLALFVPYAASLDYELDVYIRVYKIPRIQNWTMELSGENADVTNVRVDGDLTAAFPDGIVILQTDLSPMASDSAITKVIKKRVFFGGNNFKATRVRAENLKTVHWRLDKTHSSEEVEFEKEVSTHSTEDYGLGASVKSMKENEIIMHISFDSGWSSSGGRLGVSIGGTIFDRTIVLPEHKILLIGFPSHDKGPRGTVFWIAVSANKNDSQAQ
jgi:hypothetical protein